MNSGEVWEVFFASGHSDQAVLRRAIRIGAREFFNVPIEDEEIKLALEGFKGRKEKAESNVSQSVQFLCRPI